MNETDGHSVSPHSRITYQSVTPAPPITHTCIACHACIAHLTCIAPHFIARPTCTTSPTCISARNCIACHTCIARHTVPRIAPMRLVTMYRLSHLLCLQRVASPGLPRRLSCRWSRCASWSRWWMRASIATASSRLLPRPWAKATRRWCSAPAGGL